MAKCLLIALLWLPIWNMATSEVASSFRIVYTANRQGDIEPCGCQTGQFGGLNRLQTYLDGLREQGLAPDLVADSGDTFFSTEKLLPHRALQDREKAKLIARAYRKMGVGFFTPGERDFAAGIDFLRALQRLSGVKFIASNLVTPQGKPLFSTYYVDPEKRFGVIGLASPEAFKSVKRVWVLPPIAVLWKACRQLKDRGVERIILLSHLGLKMDREIAQLGLVDVILGSHSMDILAQPARVGRALIFQPQVEGQQVGVAELKWGQPEKVVHRLVDLDPSYEKPNEVKAMMDTYYKRIRKPAAARKPVKKKVSHPQIKPYVAYPKQCRSCHVEQYDWWEKTKHSSAYMVLFSKNQHFNPECIGCHSLGYNVSQGYSDITYPVWLKKQFKVPAGQTYVENLMKGVFLGELKNGPLDSRIQPKRHQKLHTRYTKTIAALDNKEHLKKIFIGVQCEHCHGNRQDHLKDATATSNQKVSSTSCKQCHVPPNDTDFNFSRDVKIVGCPKKKQ